MTIASNKGAVLGALVGLALAGAAWFHVAFEQRERIVIVVSLDTTRPDHLSAYGYQRPTSPTLERLAAEGANFVNARSVTSWTLPSHMSLFTGQPPAVHGVTIDFEVLDRAIPTLGELFAHAGFETGGFFSAPYVHGQFGFDRAMDFYESVTTDPIIYDLPKATIRAQLGLREQMSHREVTSSQLVHSAKNFLLRSGNRRKLLFLHFFDPHYDFMAPPAIEARFTDPRYRGTIDGEHVMLVNAPDAELDDADRRQLAALYDAELAWVDAHLADLVRFLEEQGLAESTTLVVTGDHGEEFFERGRFGHRAGLYDEVLRVPLIVWAPGRVPAGVRIEEDVSLVDILPTVLELADVETDAELAGRSLVPLIRGESLPARATTASLTFLPPEPVGAYTQHDAIVYEGLKCIRRVDRRWTPSDERDLSGPEVPGTEVIEVYDLRRDPGETTDLSGRDDPRVVAVVDELRRQLAEQRAAAARLSSGDSPQAALDLSYKELLQANGYVGAIEDVQR